MNSHHYGWLTIILMLLLVININISKEILTWIRSRSRIFTLLALLWFVPFVGAYCIYQKDNVSPAWRYNTHNVSNGTQTGSALLALDLIYNPAAKNLIEIVEQQKIQNNIQMRQSKIQGYDEIIKNLMSIAISK